MVSTDSSEKPEKINFRFKKWWWFAPTCHAIVEQEEHRLHIDVESELENDNSGSAPEDVVEDDDKVERERAKHNPEDDWETTEEGEKSCCLTDGNIDLS